VEKRITAALMLLSALASAGTCAAQDAIYVSRNTHISFYSSAPIEDIAAQTDQAVSAINWRTGSVFFKVPIKSFTFERQLMQDHFNSDYLESDKYPYAQFRGVISGLPPLTADTGLRPVTVKGVFTIHGVSRDYEGPGAIHMGSGSITAFSTFNIRLADYKIKIPSILIKNIAEVVQVKVRAVYLPPQPADSVAGEVRAPAP
jgi:polyisoprenoid-binding protein YceI